MNIFNSKLEYDASQYQQDNIRLQHECDSLQLIIDSLIIENSHSFRKIDSLKAEVQTKDQDIVKNKKRYEEKIHKIDHISNSDVFQLWESYVGK